MVKEENYFPSRGNLLFEKKIWTIEDLSYVLNKSERTIKRYVQNDEIPYRRRKTTLYFFAEEILEWLDEGE